MDFFAFVAILKRGAPPPPLFSDLELKSNIHLIDRGQDVSIRLLPEGNVFQISRNVLCVYKISPGFIRILFRQPKQDLLVCSRRFHVEQLCRLVQLVMLQRPNPGQEYDCTVTQINLSESLREKGIPTQLSTFLFLNELDLNNNNIENIPEELGALPFIKSLKLEKNNLGNAKSWRWLTSPIIRGTLQDLNLSSNNLTHVPEALLELSKLEFLFLTDNMITELPFSFGKLRNIICVSLSGNRLRYLPASIRRLGILSSLYMKSNRFGEGVQEYRAGQRLVTEADFKIKSLKQIAAQGVVHHSYPYWRKNIPVELNEYLENEAKTCVCGRPIFTEQPISFTRLVRIESLATVVLADIDAVALALRYYACSYACYNRFRPPSLNIGGRAVPLF